MLHEAFGEHSLSRTAVFKWHSSSKAGRISVENDEGSGQPSTCKTTENVKKIIELIHEGRRRTIHEIADTVWISYGVCQEILTENLDMPLIFYHANAPAHTSMKTTEFLTNNNMVIVPHPPYSPDLAPCDFALFPKLKMKLKERRFETVSDVQKVIACGTRQH
jgi:transposase